jgi:hypothetical protein
LPKRWQRSYAFIAPGENPQGGGRRARKKPSKAVAIISYDEKPGIQAIATTAPDPRRSSPRSSAAQ